MYKSTLFLLLSLLSFQLFAQDADKTPSNLYEAVEMQNLEMVKSFIENGANPNSTDDIGQAILVFCVPMDDEEKETQVKILEYLLQNGADPNYGGTRNVPAMIPAAAHGAIKTMQVLIEYGGDIECKVSNKTPLDFAKDNNKPLMVAFLKKEIEKHPTIKPKIQDNSKLTYNVDFFGRKYQFIMDIFQTAPQVTFQWRMTLEGRDDKNGTITMNEEALKYGYKLYNLFDNGEIILDDNTTCVWVSERVFRDIKDTEMINGLQTGPGDDSYRNYSYTRNEKLMLANGKKVDTQLWTDENGEGKVWVLDDKDNRLIMKMDLGWTIVIDTIQE